MTKPASLAAKLTPLAAGVPSAALPRVMCSAQAVEV